MDLDDCIGEILDAMSWDGEDSPIKLQLKKLLQDYVETICSECPAKITHENRKESRD